MSVIVIAKFPGDTAKFVQALQERADEFERIRDQAKTAGAIHHRFGVGDGFVVAVDEWASADQFNAFMGDPELQQFIGSVGAAPGPPDLTISTAIESPDQF